MTTEAVLTECSYTVLRAARGPRVENPWLKPIRERQSEVKCGTFPLSPLGFGVMPFARSKIFCQIYFIKRLMKQNFIKRTLLTEKFYKILSFIKYFTK